MPAVHGQESAQSKLAVEPRASSLMTSLMMMFITIFAGD